MWQDAGDRGYVTNDIKNAFLFSFGFTIRTQRLNYIIGCILGKFIIIIIFFQIFIGTTKQLHQLYEENNQIHPTLEFTMIHTSIDNESEADRCDCRTT